ncbi:MAG: SDR family NAD(P)-dependent oxidoreductase [Qingshengfaniella sp.]
MSDITPNRHKGRTHVITGSAQGIGLAYARRLGQEGARVILADIKEDTVAAAADALRSEGIDAMSISMDVASPDSAAAFAEALTQQVKRVDGVINNAAIFSTLTLKPFWDIDPAEWDKVMAVNVRGPWLVTRALLPLLKASDHASVINIGSDAVWMGKDLYAHYVASKGAIFGMSNAMARELGPFGIRVNSLSPGFTMTEVPRATFTDQQRNAILAAQALDRVADTDDMVGVASFLLSDDSRWMTGQTLHVNGGMSCH